ncbi:SGNH/GDSL hydrolase family protein [Mucilaginibacter hurinus]|nr:SGNH/GDSL hydrolase family protein [Mucilaginibacter hurinus]
MRSMNELYYKPSYLPSFFTAKKRDTIIRLILVVLLVTLMATIQGCTKKVSPQPVNNTVDVADRGIKEFSLPGSVQVGETVFNLDGETYVVTIKLKPGANLTSITPSVKLAAGAFIHPAVGKLVTTGNSGIYKVTLPSGTVQNWKINLVYEDAAYVNDIFKENSKVMFVGNSITHGGRYHSYIWLYYMTRFPNHRITVLNGGIAGDIVANINNRMVEDIFPKNPDVLNLTFGMNDSGYFQYLFTDPVKTSNRLVFQCDSAFKLVINKLQGRPQMQTIIMSGSPYDAKTTAVDGYWSEKPATYERIVTLQKNAAEANNWKYIDAYHPMDQINRFFQQYDPKFTISGRGDRVHPESEGHLVWAYIYLRNQNLKGHDVADFTIDAAKGLTTGATNCVISDVVSSGGNVSFNYKAYALPFPLDETKRSGDTRPASAAVKYISFMQDLNREMITVQNLAGKTYDLKIDGKVVGRFSADTLAKGINMAAIKTTPQYLQAMELLKKNEERFSTEKTMRDYYVQVYNFARPNGITNDSDPASLEKMKELKKTNAWIDLGLYERGSKPETRNGWQDKMDNLVNEIYAANKPLKRKIELVKVN